MTQTELTTVLHVVWTLPDLSKGTTEAPVKCSITIYDFTQFIRVYDELYAKLSKQGMLWASCHRDSDTAQGRHTLADHFQH